MTTIPTFVTGETLIGEAVMRYPVTAEIMMSYGLACVGCHVSAIETIEQGARGHGQMSDEEINELVQEMNEAIAERESATKSGEPLTITKKAIEKIKEFAAKEEEQKNIFLRVAVTAGGCSGFKYKLEFEHEPKKEDKIITLEKTEIRIDPASLEFLQGSVLDYIDGLQGSGFKIDNPNKSQECGCGKSFS